MLVDAAACAVVVSFGRHASDPHCGRFTHPLIQFGHHTTVVVVTDGECDVFFVNQTWHFADLIDRAAGGAATEQHGRRSAQQVNSVIVKRVTVIEGRIAHAVEENVAGRRKRKAAQANVFFTALSRQERDARCAVQRLFHGVDVAVNHQLFGDHCDRLRNVAQRLIALADGRGRGADRVFALRRFGLFFDEDGGKRFAVF